MSVTLQRYVLPASESHVRVPLNESLVPSDAWKCKVISFVRNKPTWVEPKTYVNLSAHPELASHLIFLKSPDWSHTHSLYPVSTSAANCNLIVDPQSSKVFMNIRRVIPGEETEVYVVRGRTTGNADARKVVKIAVEAARKLVGGREKVVRDIPFWDGVGICTWESFGKEAGRPTKETIVNLVPSYPIKTFLIDDGWQDITRKPYNDTTGEVRALHSFQGWDGMTASMTEVVHAIKATGVEQVGVWMTLQGYWLGIDGESELARKYDCREYKTAKLGVRGGVQVPLEQGTGAQFLPSVEKAPLFWLDWFTEMKRWGIGFVKVDNQADYDQMVGEDVSQVQQAMWRGMLEAVEKVWGTDRVIMCMSHNERMLNGPGGLDFDRPKGNLVFRNSDDYNLAYDNCHPDFIQFNTHFSILTAHLSFVPDFDMFATAPESKWPIYHSLLRALSPGPTLVSDTPDVTTDPSIVNRLTARTKEGHYKAIKTSTPAVALPGRWFWDNLQGDGDGPAIIASVKVSSALGAIIAAWNCRNASGQSWAKDRLSLQDIEEALEVESLEGEYALWSLGLSGKGDKVTLVAPGQRVGFELTLARSECEAVVVAKVLDLGSGQRVAVVGMLEKLAPLAGLNVSIEGGELIIHCPYDNVQLSVLSFGDGDLHARTDGRAVSATAIASVHVADRIRLTTITVGGEGALEAESPSNGLSQYELRISAV